MDFTNEDLFNIVMIYSECHRVLQRTCDVFQQRFPQRPAINVRKLKRILKNLKEHGSFEVKKVRRQTVINEENTITVLAYFHALPSNSIFDAVRDLGLGYSSIQKILKRNNFFPYKIDIVQFLKDTDFQRRIQFCEWLLTKTQEDDNFLKTIIWSDESKFTKNGIFNRRNSHLWALEKPTEARVSNFQESWSFNVYCAIKDNEVAVLKFYDGNLNGSLVFYSNKKF